MEAATVGDVTVICGFPGRSVAYCDRVVDADPGGEDAGCESGDVISSTMEGR